MEAACEELLGDRVKKLMLNVVGDNDRTELDKDSTVVHLSSVPTIKVG